MKRMAHITASVIITFLWLGIYSGCGPDSEEKPSIPTTASTRMITDMTGRKIKIPEPENIERVAVQTSPQVLNIYAVGVSEKLCAVTNAIKRWPLLAKADPRLKDVPATRAGNAQINMEALLSTKPDVCIGSESDMRVIEDLTDLPTLRISMARPGAHFQSVKNEVTFLGKVFGKEIRAKVFTDYLDNMLGMVREATADISTKDRMIVFMGFDADHLTTYGGDTFMDEWIEASGCKNAAGSIKTLGGREGGLRSVSLEHVLTWNPDIIIIDSGKPQDLYDKPAWSKIKAVKEKRVYRLPIGLFLWSRSACEAAVLFPQWLGYNAYPERFKAFDFRNYTMTFYHDVFGFDFNENEIDKILNPQDEENVDEKHT